MSQLLRIPQVVPILSRETIVSLTSLEMKRRSSQNWIIPTMKTIMKQGSNINLNLIKLVDKYQFLQVNSSFQGIQTFYVDIVSLVVILDIRLCVAGLLDIIEM
jgi:hypothetical protein